MPYIPPSTQPKPKPKEAIDPTFLAMAAAIQRAKLEQANAK